MDPQPTMWMWSRELTHRRSTASQLKEMDCITCHNRITHHVYTPEESVDNAMISLGVISRDIPEIRQQGVEVLRGEYATPGAGARSDCELWTSTTQTHYSGFYGAHTDQVQQAIDGAAGDLLRRRSSLTRRWTGIHIPRTSGISIRRDASAATTESTWMPTSRPSAWSAMCVTRSRSWLAQPTL